MEILHIMGERSEKVDDSLVLTTLAPVPIDRRLLDTYVYQTYQTLRPLEGLTIVVIGDGDQVLW